MAIAFSCSHCGKSFQVADDLSGKKGKCKQCGFVFVIPAPVAVPPAPGRTRAARRPPPRARGRDHDRPRRGPSTLTGLTTSPCRC